MGPRINPALHTVWRDASTLQIGLRAPRRLLVGQLSAADRRLLAQLGAPPEPGAPARSRVTPDVDVDERVLTAPLVQTLRRAGVLVEGDQACLHDAHIAPEYHSASVVYGDPPTPADGAGVIGGRAGRAVTVVGCGRIGAAVARLLSAAGVGRVRAEDAAPVAVADCMPGGMRPELVGTPRGRAVEHLAATSRRPSHLDRSGSGASAPSDHPDNLVVVAAENLADRAVATSLLRDGVPHLVVEVVEAVGVIGPLIEPGRTSCLRCHDLHRTERDPQWPRLLAMLDRSAGRGRAVPHACDVSLATVVAGLTVQHALHHLDTGASRLHDATVEITLPDGLPRRRSWEPHPACGCRWAT
ncbi:MAG TPA: hypothetical protein VK053_23435 [Jiangellaceae bacterium]|nr:hypothetical protein [Jiangellaceae bacterium]